MLTYFDQELNENDFIVVNKCYKQIHVLPMEIFE